MKIRLLAVLVLCFSLLGCARQSAAPSPGSRLPNRLVPTKETENDILRCYPLDSPECRFFANGDDLFLLRPENGYACLLRYSGKNLLLTAAYYLPDEKCTAQISGNRICCYCPAGQQVWILRRDLTQERCLHLPEPIRGAPLLCPDGCHLYCCAGARLICMDIPSGTWRLLREMGSSQSVPAAILDGGKTILCTEEQAPERTLYLSTEDGSLLRESPPVISVAAFGNREYRAVRCGFNDCLLLEEKMLAPETGTAFLAFLPDLHSALFYRENQLILCDLNTGNQTASVQMDGQPIHTAGIGGRIFFLLNGSLYQWTPATQPTQVSKVRLAPAEPGKDGLAQCRSRAAFVEDAYGFTIPTEAPVVPMGDVTVCSEQIPSLWMDALTRIERSMARFPAGLIQAAVRNTRRTYLCPVRSIRAEDGTLLDYSMVWNGRDCCICIAISDRMGEALIRCISALLDSRILVVSDIYDTWPEMNPLDFRYGQAALPDMDAFADLRSMTSPAEDRAGILLAAMKDGNRELFCSAILQTKLRRVCTGIRRAFPPESSTPYLWEQYLWEPIA